MPVKKAAPKKGAGKSTPLPPGLATAADKIYLLREQRYKLQKQVDAIEAKESELRDYIINNLPKSRAEGVTGRIAHVEIKRKNVPQAKDWGKIWKYIFKTKDDSLLQKRLNESAINERWEKNKVVPGVEAFMAISLSITKK